MRINNPGVLDGSITTAKIADGAVTNAKITGPISVANGGTGTAAPALVAGTNISVTGSFPDQTVDVVDSPTFAGEVIAEADIALHEDANGAIHFDNAAGTPQWEIVHESTAGVQGDLVIFNNITSKNTMSVDTADKVHFANPIQVADGGTGASTLLSAGLAEILGSTNANGATASVTSPVLASAPATGLYRVEIAAWPTAVSGSGTMDFQAGSTHGGTTASSAIKNDGSIGAANTPTSAVFYVFADSGTTINADITPNGFSSITFDWYATVTRVA